MSSTPHAEGADVVLRLPLLADVTYNEAHSALLGLVGVLAGAGFRAGYPEEVVGFTVLAVCIAFGCRRLEGDHVPIARRVVRREPWYFLTVYVACTVGAGLLYPVAVA